MTDGDTARGPGELDYFGKRYAFQHVFEEEIKIINRRRGGPTNAVESVATDAEVDRRTGATTLHVEDERETVALGDADRPLQGQIALEPEGRDVNGQAVLRPNADANVVGLALSGGGVRSAAFCLGVLQALDAAKVLPKVDYLSTVSGGGYIGCALTAALESTGTFPFASTLQEDEPPALQQIRDYSNYLFPRGQSGNLLHNASVYARGLAVNVVLVASVVFAAAALTILYFPLRAYVPQFPFFLTAVFAPIVLAAGIAWGVFRSLRPLEDHPEYSGRWVKAVGFLIVALFAVAFLELQPIMLDAMLGADTGHAVTVIIKWINRLAVALAPLGAAAGYLSNKLGEYAKSTMQSPQWSGTIKAVLTKAAIVIGGLILPLLIWVLFLDLTYVGLNLGSYARNMLQFNPSPNPIWPHLRAMVLFAAIAVICFGVSLLMQPNANSLHPLYRDRLKKAFLFVPQPTLGEDDLPAFTKPLSKISGLRGPYHLINAALNIEESKTANRRGRNADFFIFSPQFVGSKTTDYVRTADMEDVVSNLSLAAAMATSGAAVSSNMGAENIKPLTPTLALLNIRLGFWLRNPRVLARARPHPEPASMRGRFHEYKRHRNFLANYYFIAEMFGLLSETYKSIYLTDGGHIENLGIYELLRRRCKVIIAVDAEADPQMAFGSFNTLERYVLIDLGVRIDLRWEPIADKSLVTSAAIDNAGALTAPSDGSSGGKTSQVPKDHGPHCAIGRISYPNRGEGILIYIKASLTGDENDYVFDYKKRYSAFPHETTLDQLFTEEQFECYRALGFHAAFRLFDRDDPFGHPDPDEEPGVVADLHLLDRLFPRPDPDSPDPPQQKKTFAAWLTAAKAVKAPPKPRAGRGKTGQGSPSPPG